MLLADAATPNANTVWLVILVLAGLGGNIATIVAVFQGSKKQKREVSFEFVPASKEEFDEQKQHCTRRHAELFAGIERIEKATSATIETKVDFVRREVVEVGKEVAALQTATGLQNQTLSNLNAKLDRLIERKHER
jgi:hypothetical protein